MSYAPGDVIFAHGRGFLSRAIQIAEKVRLKSGKHPNHAAIIVDVDKLGQVRIVQATSKGVTSLWYSSPKDLAPGGNVVVVPRPCPDWLAAVDFANEQVGMKYGYLTIFSIAVSIIAPWFLTIRRPGTWICSALVAQSLLAGGRMDTWPDVYQVTPAQLYEAVIRSDN